MKGDLWLDDDRAVFLPWQPWAADTQITWVLDACGERRVGGFTTGTVLRPPTDEELAERYVDVPYSLDLRVADWTQPVPRGDAAKDPKAMARVGYRFGPSFLTMVTAADDDTLTLRLAPAVAEMNGIYTQDDCRAAWELTVPRGDGAYVALAFTAVEAQANGEPVALRELSFSLGLGRDGFEDGRLAGELDLRDYEAEDGRDGCRLFEDLTGHACEPCSTDHVNACAPIEARGISGLVSDEAPVRPGESG